MLPHRPMWEKRGHESQRRSATTVPMLQEVAVLGLRDMIDAAAFAASRKP